MTIIEELIEELAELEHEQWMEWSKELTTQLIEPLIYLLLHEKTGNAYDLLVKRKNRWEQLWIPYKKLSEEMKDEDRKWAEKVLKVLLRKDSKLGR